MNSQTKRWLLMAAAALIAYTAHYQLQLWRGREAVKDTQLVFKPLDAALSQARLEGKPVLVDFTADWCPSCLRLHQSVFTDPAVKQVLGRDYVLAMVNSDAADAEPLMARYGVRGFPTLLVLDGQGRPLRDLPVSFDPAQFRAALAAPG